MTVAESSLLDRRGHGLCLCAYCMTLKLFQTPIRNCSAEDGQCLSTDLNYLVVNQTDTEFG